VWRNCDKVPPISVLYGRCLGEIAFALRLSYTREVVSGVDWLEAWVGCKVLAGRRNENSSPIQSSHCWELSDHIYTACGHSIIERSLCDLYQYVSDHFQVLLTESLDKIRSNQTISSFYGVSSTFLSMWLFTPDFFTTQLIFICISFTND
jgi:hypothetical protein